MSESVLPPLLVLTDRRQSEAAGRSLVETVAALVEVDGLAVVFREKDLGTADRHRLAAQVAETGVGLIVASDAELAADLGAAGVHLAADDPLPRASRLLGRSCHDLGEIEQAQREGVDYATLSPVFETPSKPGYGPGLRLAGLSSASGAVSLPIYALGGVTPANSAECINAGATGVAAMGAVMAAGDPGDVARRLLDTVPR